MADAKNSNLEKLALVLNVAQTKFQNDSVSLGKKSLKVEQEIAGEDDDKREDQLDAINDTLIEIKNLLSKSGAGKGKENQLKQIKDSTSPLSITRVDGESAGKILSAATDDISKDLEKFTDEERKMMTELVKEIGKLTEKNLEGFNKGIKEVIDLAKKGQKLAEQSGNTEGAKRFGDTAKAAKEEYFKQNKMGLRGDKDTFVNRFGRLMGVKDEYGNAKEFNTKKSGFKETVKAFGTAAKASGKEAVKEFGKGLLRGSKGSAQDQLFSSDKTRRAEERQEQGWAPEAEQLSDLTDAQKKMLAEKGIAPASEKDIAYRKDGKPVSLDTINAELEKDFEEKTNKTAIISGKDTQEQVAAGIEPSPTQPSSELQEDAAGLSESPVVDAIQENTKKLDEISDTFKEANELFEAIKESVEKIADSLQEAQSNQAGSDNQNQGPSIDIDLPGRRGRPSAGNIPDGNGRRQTRSERARSQPRDAKGRFVKRTPEVPVGRRPGRGRGILGALAVGAGAIGLGSLFGGGGDDDTGAADVAANTAMSAADLAPAPGEAKAAEKGTAKAGEKAAAKAGEKATVKAGEKATVKAGEKVAAKGVAKVGAKAVGKSLLKKIPGVSILAGGAFATQRAMQGDWLGAGGELLSGVAGTIPGLGTAASVGIDAALAARDMGALGGTPETRAAAAAQGGQAQPASAAPRPAAVQGKPGGGIFSRAAGFVKKNPLMAAAGLGGVGLAAVGASKAWDWMTGGDDKKVESGQNPDSGILEQGTEQARDKMQVNVPPPTVINQGGGGNATAEKTTVPNTKSYVRDDESSWMRFALKRAMA